MLRIVEGGDWGGGQKIEDEMARALGIPIIEVNFNDLGRAPEVEFTVDDAVGQIIRSASRTRRLSRAAHMNLFVTRPDEAEAARRLFSELRSSFSWFSV